MNLHEYQAKSVLSSFGANVPYGIIACSAEEAVDAAKKITEKTGFEKWAIKAQVHAGGRGKGGGVKVAGTFDEVREKARQILGMTLVTPQTSAKGKLVRKVLVEQNIYYPGPSPIREFYFSILLNRATGRNMIVFSQQGGMDIEEVADKTPELIFHEEIHPGAGLRDFQCRMIAARLGLVGEAAKNMAKLAKAVYRAYLGMDASMIEINPVFKTSDDKIIAADAKVVADNSALFRHPDIEKMRDLDEEDPTEVEAGKHHLNYVKLDGNVGCMVNGAGLAMATMDIIKLSGGEPANFLDVGGSANAERVERAFRIILKDPNVKAILVNIFGGIVRGDRVANGIVDAYRNIGEIKIPIIVRLQGTNAVEAKEIIEKSGLKVQSAILLKEAADLVRRALEPNA
ncbi:MAG: ADP-forming succinate--CoA ligase subunit beta [Bacteroidetes bacterium]|nr:ADP-forming succinate--CoA ligase subunit beta [Bacteroidota bacterium]